MGGISNALNVGKSGLLSGQKALEVVGNNISNVNTPGYSRQVPVFSDFPTLNMKGFAVGRGAQVALVAREHDAFVSKQIEEKNANLGEEDAKASPMAELERIVDISENSLASEIDRFFGSWQDLSADPGSRLARDMVLSSGEQLALAFARPIGELTALRENLNINLSSQVTDLNTKFEQVASLNQRITTIEASGQTALADRDQRDLLLQDISYALGTRSIESAETGMVSIFLPNGIPVVQDVEAMSLSLERVGDTLNVNLQMGSQQMNLTPESVGGNFRGTLQMRDETIPGLIGEIDTLAYSLVTEVNTVHRWGEGLDGVNSRDFFVQPVQPDGAASALVMNIDDYRQVAAGRSTAPGDNSNALAISDLGSQQLVDGKETFVGFYGRIAGNLGVEASRNQLAQTGSQDALTQLTNLRDSKVGVSLEEEMVSLIKFQNGFEASAKFLSTVDEMMDSLLALKR